MYVSRAGPKLEHGLKIFGLTVSGLTCADFGCSTGGFTDCLLQAGAATVYAVDTGYGVLDYKLRNDPRVVVMERTNAMHVRLPRQVDVVTVDVSWTRQRNVLPSVRRAVVDGGAVVSLIKPHYEAESKSLVKGILPIELISGVIDAVKIDIAAAGFDVLATTESPIKGAKGNTEVLALLRPSGPQYATIIAG